MQISSGRDSPDKNDLNLQLTPSSKNNLISQKEPQSAYWDKCFEVYYTGVPYANARFSLKQRLNNTVVGELMWVTHLT